MAGFQAQDLTVHFDYKDNKIGKNCDSVACKYKGGRTHYHCRYCSFVRAGLSYDKMIKHMRSKHSSNLVSQVSTEEQQTLTELNIESDPSDPALEKSPQLSPPRSFIIKKAKFRHQYQQNLVVCKLRLHFLLCFIKLNLLTKIHVGQWKVLFTQWKFEYYTL